MKTQHPPICRILPSITAGFLLMLGLSSCATTHKSYQGVTRPQSEIGLLILGGGFSENLCRFRTILERINETELSPPPRTRYGTIEVLPGEYAFVFNCYFEVGGTVASPGVGTIRMGQGLLYPDCSRQAVRMTMLAGHKYQVRYNFCGQLGWGTTDMKSFQITDLTTQDVVIRRDIPVRYIEPSVDDGLAASISTQGDGIMIASIDDQLPPSTNNDPHSGRTHSTPVNHIALLPGPHVIDFECTSQEGPVRLRTNIVASAGARYTARRQMQGYSLSVLLHETKR